MRNKQPASFIIFLPAIFLPQALLGCVHALPPRVGGTASSSVGSRTKEQPRTYPHPASRPPSPIGWEQGLGVRALFSRMFMAPMLVHMTCTWKLPNSPPRAPSRGFLRSPSEAAPHMRGRDPGGSNQMRPPFFIIFCRPFFCLSLFIFLRVPIDFPIDKVGRLRQTTTPFR